MSNDDNELEQLKKKRLAEMQKNISFKKQIEETSTIKEEKPSARELLLKNLGYRGLEVLQNAEAQYPRETKIVVEKLGELIQMGEINEEIDGGKLLALLRTVGLNIRMETKISVEKEGKFVSLSEKLSSTKENKPQENEN